MVERKTVGQKLSKAVQEVPIELGRFMQGRYPHFVTAQHPGPLRDEVPVFMFHTVETETFETQLRYLEQNHYHTLTLGEFMAFLAGSLRLKQPAVLLTFDDGEKSLYEVAYPLLQRYGFHAVAYVIPYYMRQDPDLTSGKGWCSWDQLVQMDRSGVVEIESHTYYHDQVFASPKLVEFYHPGYNDSVLGMDVPWIDGDSGYTNDLPWGAPIHTLAPRMKGMLRYNDDPRVRQACIRFVTLEGGEQFFTRPGWRKRIQHFYDLLTRSNVKTGYESKTAQYAGMLADLVKSRRAIEDRLDRPVTHLCYPWGAGSHLAVTLSRRAGYTSNMWVSLPGPHRNAPGSSPFAIQRVKDDYLFRLPGKGRAQLVDIFRLKLNRRARTVDLY